MTKKQAILQIMKDSESKGLVLSSFEISQRAGFLIEDSEKIQKKRNEYNVLSSKNSGSRNLRPITTLNSLTMPVLRDLTTSSAAEFLGEEIWCSFKTMSEKLVAKRVFEYMRARLTRGMC